MGSSVMATNSEQSPQGPQAATGFTDEEAMAHVDALYRTALRMTRNPADAEDLVQEAYLRAFRFRDKFLAGSNLRAWLFKILSNAAISRFRHVSHESNDTSLDEMADFELYDRTPLASGGWGGSAEE